MNFARLSVRARLLLAFGSLGALVAIVSVVALLALSQSNARFENYVRGIGARAMTANAVRSAVERRAVAIRNLALVSDTQEIAFEREAVVVADADVKKSLERLEELAQPADVPAEVRQRIMAIDQVEQDYHPVAKQILDLLVANNRDEAVSRISKDCRPRLAALVKAVDEYLDFTSARQEHQIAAVATEYHREQAVLLAICILTFVSASAAGIAISRQLTRALGAEPAVLRAAAERVASGDLSRLPGAEAAVPGSVMSTLAMMQQSLAKVVSAVRDASNSIATGSAQIASGNADLSHRTERQAANVQQTASSMEQMTVSVANNAETAHKASEIASAASEAAGGGGQAMTSVASKMEDITTSSRRIGDIIGVIDGIAFQTNILALNAAVEAARAGEQGRGFAVVASEVRLLARRSAEAAKEVKVLIERSARDVEDGEQLVAGASKAMEQIVERVKTVSSLISEISQASTEQQGGIGAVGSAMSHLDQTTQQNAALVEESAAAAESLREQAVKLLNVVSVFRLE